VNNHSFCTIITADYYPYAQALLESLEKHSSQGVILEVLIAERIEDKSFFQSIDMPNINFSFIEEINLPIASQLFDKYNATNMDAYRWSMKPVFINHLLIQKGYEKVIYLDSDLFFFQDPRFLFELLDKEKVILTPHWRCADNPWEDFHNFKLNFKDGIYNGGFVGVRKDALDVMFFWANLCLAACEVNRPEGFFVDQKYLDILHSRFEGIGVVRHRGCNVSNWNISDCQRVVTDNGEILINGIFPIVFIHFTSSMMKGILSGIDLHLLNHFTIYADTIKKYNPEFNLIEKTKKQLTAAVIENDGIWNKQKKVLKKIRNKIRLRSRIKNILQISLKN
jgi:hypothetical protein